MLAFKVIFAIQTRVCAFLFSHYIVNYTFLDLNGTQICIIVS